MSKKTKKKTSKSNKKVPKDSRDWFEFNKRISALRGVSWKKKQMASRTNDSSSLMQIERVSKGISRPDIARALGLKSVTSILRIERGQSPVTEKRALVIAKVLNTTPRRIFNKVPYKKKYFVISA